ncbi:hypothetical protein jhhlp_006887 [Lomentospora prolificans]|uniref:2'-phosphotransferase n=1 Tax=Lomentospora prolificans TaxID=41688 RepID=A0A2N3N320_9PEZI|nr:hypothetical protein jhhlp_006887 [Lomentospora prolificans]
MADSLEERAYAEAERAGRNRGRGGGGGGGDGGGMKREVRVSKTLSRLLRHQINNAGIQIDSSGYAELDKVLAWQPLRSLQVTFEDVLTVVRNNEKQRFSMKPNPTTNPSEDATSTDPTHWLIRANQGHSIAIASEALMKPITLEEGNVPAVAVHGTYFAFWPLIVQSGGLKPMGRNHVHLATGVPGSDAQVVSGMRRDAELLVYVDVAASLADGAMKWWISENGVVLTEGNEDGLVPTKYFKEVVGRSTDVGVLFRDGQHLADLPEGIKGIVPPGKGRGGGRSGGGRGRRGRGRGGRA